MRLEAAKNAAIYAKSFQLRLSIYMNYRQMSTFATENTMKIAKPSHTLLFRSKYLHRINISNIIPASFTNTSKYQSRIENIQIGRNK